MTNGHANGVGHPTNGDEGTYPNRIGNFHKGLPHDNTGEVDAGAYASLLKAVKSRARGDFEKITLGQGRKFTNPMAGIATDTEGPTPETLTMAAPPAVNSAEEAGEAVELYWMALLRDVPFTAFDSDAGVGRATADLKKLTRSASVSRATVFRGLTNGDKAGPFVSQFLLKDVHYGALTINQKIRALAPGNDYLTEFDSWLAVQNGYQPGADQFDSTARHIRNMRDLAQYVHIDALYQAYLNACLILLDMKAPLNRGNPYNPGVVGSSRTMIGFATFGDPHILSLVTEVATRALKAVWYQKWFVHRRLRPEAYGGLVHLRKKGVKNYPIHNDVLQSQALVETFDKYGSYLLPQAFPEGSPTHPSYGAGHATVAGACVTLLKAWFDETAVLPSSVVSSPDGLELVPYLGHDAHQLSIGGELNKLAANIAIGRNMAGVHWYSDYAESIKLGEQVALTVLFNQRKDYKERYSFSFTGFEGDRFEISAAGIKKNGQAYPISTGHRLSMAVPV
ncbi:MAG: vanadium-dependent haloperoxidase [Herpetosiphon sp.]